MTQRINGIISKNVAVFISSCDSLYLSQSYEFYAYLLKSKEIDTKAVFELNNGSLAKVLPLLKVFIGKCFALHQVCQV